MPNKKPFDLTENVADQPIKAKIGQKQNRIVVSIILD